MIYRTHLERLLSWKLLALSKTFARKLVLTSILRGKKKLLSAQANYKSKYVVQRIEDNDLYVKFLSLAYVFHVSLYVRSLCTIFLWKPTCP